MDDITYINLYGYNLYHISYMDDYYCKKIKAVFIQMQLPKSFELNASKVYHKI